ncbi:cytochrome b/b6 domain-containing protein [Parasphingorhabdus cellanae]|uniref:Cytochrome b/b6 domain-containing protein n=1 Tax=Parasphingorhabdus cellanae TaxID=2806553 RepID=A0ABX7T6M7_9SPHN|nr:cytochrome b/b6 domain-containing protein [Parasphingorhabdus cellanae]QTD55875.1 cytochrome b/b6 domain-containing protein [Parasphingorhabdus cellanae]
MTSKAGQTLVWDWTIRLFHWLIVLLLPLMWWTAEEGMMDWHRRLGLTLFAVILFRLIWGIIGSWTARFVPMIKRLAAVPAYVRDLFAGRHRPSFGHSPLGSLSVFALLAALSVQVGTGLFTVDVDGLESGPLSILISFSTGRDIADIHELNFDILVALIALHIVAIAIYRWVLKDNLIRPMVTGHRNDVEPASVVNVRPVALIASIAIVAGSLYAVMNAG